MGRPKIMDQVTASMCQMGIGKISYARVLVNVEAVKELKSAIKIEYVDKGKNVKGSKEVQVEYEWKPKRCSHCMVFWHNVDKCKVRNRTESEIKEQNAEAEKLKTKQYMQNDGFIDVQQKKVIATHKLRPNEIATYKSTRTYTNRNLLNYRN
ncbi:hypothetical protein CTI12_AA618000 [Artemisia annua]|uniref:Zinc knuckle CX2CX4HX4C n=1 Tax=Artemisia annua TaxID=35608 RepID=A0A2U1KCV2_ARTAN|nr:hypothetical protein CTI12_AA618000 [Artemisia annua]